MIPARALHPPILQPVGPRNGGPYWFAEIEAKTAKPWAQSEPKLGGKLVKGVACQTILLLPIAMRFRWDEREDGKNRSRCNLLAWVAGGFGVACISTSGMATKAVSSAHRNAEWQAYCHENESGAPSCLYEWIYSMTVSSVEVSGKGADFTIEWRAVKQADSETVGKVSKWLESHGGEQTIVKWERAWTQS